MTTSSIKKNVRVMGCDKLRHSLCISYSYMGDIYQLLLPWQNIDEKMLEAVGEDYETAKLEDGNICQADQISLVIGHLQRIENRNEAKKIVDSNTPLFADLLRKYGMNK